MCYESTQYGSQISCGGRRGMKSIFRFRRSLRTGTSECYLIYGSEGLIGEISLHIQRAVEAILILFTEIDEQEVQDLLEEIEDTIVSMIQPREDFIVTVYQGREIGHYSDSVPYDPDEQPIKRKDLHDISRNINSVINRQSIAKGQLSEVAVCEYFKIMGYEAVKAKPEYDHLKIDVIAEDKEQKIYIQVKNGQINSTEIKKVVENACKLTDENKNKVVGIVADVFPKESEFFRVKLQGEFEISIIFIHKYQILQAVPEFKRTIG